MDYEALRHREAQIRLLTLHSGSGDAIVCCTVENTSLYETPKYYALSYCWGDPNITEKILVNGSEMRVTTNLEIALRQLRSDGYTTLWIDALCINQEDQEEKNLQVLRMKTIYQRAEEVIIWLGRGDERSVRSMQFIRDCGSISTVDISESTLPSRRIDPVTERALNVFISNDYWKRVWII